MSTEDGEPAVGDNKMNRTKTLSGMCSQCGTPIVFLAERIGSTAPCPHCGRPTELMLAAPPQEPTVPRRFVIISVAAIVALVLGLVICLAGLKHFENLAQRKKHNPPVTTSTPGDTNLPPPSGSGSAP